MSRLNVKWQTWLTLSLNEYRLQISSCLGFLAVSVLMILFQYLLGVSATKINHLYIFSSKFDFQFILILFLGIPSFFHIRSSGYFQLWHSLPLRPLIRSIIPVVPASLTAISFFALYLTIIIGVEFANNNMSVEFASILFAKTMTFVAFSLALAFFIASLEKGQIIYLLLAAYLVVAFAAKRNVLEFFPQLYTLIDPQTFAYLRTEMPWKDLIFVNSITFCLFLPVLWRQKILGKWLNFRHRYEQPEHMSWSKATGAVVVAFSLYYLWIFIEKQQTKKIQAQSDSWHETISLSATESRTFRFSAGIARLPSKSTAIMPATTDKLHSVGAIISSSMHSHQTSHFPDLSLFVFEEDDSDLRPSRVSNQEVAVPIVADDFLTLSAEEISRTIFNSAFWHMSHGRSTRADIAWIAVWLAAYQAKSPRSYETPIGRLRLAYLANALSRSATHPDFWLEIQQRFGDCGAQELYEYLGDQWIESEEVAKRYWQTADWVLGLSEGKDMLYTFLGWSPSSDQIIDMQYGGTFNQFVQKVIDHLRYEPIADEISMNKLKLELRDLMDARIAKVKIIPGLALYKLEENADVESKTLYHLEAYLSGPQATLLQHHRILRIPLLKAADHEPKKHLANEKPTLTTLAFTSEVLRCQIRKDWQ